MFLNDENKTKMEALKGAVAKVRCDKGCCAAEVSCLSFQQALENHLPLISSTESANLIIMDQFGVKEVTPEIIRRLAQCNRTDLLFFISSSYIRRFIETPEMRQYFDLESQEVKDQDYNVIHRYVCAYFQEKLKDLDYYLAPFSLKKGSNIYGIIFDSANLYGLDKFVKVCWALDPINGESNYNINGDFAWANKGLFDEMNKISKEEKFRRELEDFIKHNSPSNHELFRFVLTHGFRPQQAVVHLRKMSLTLEPLDPKRPCTAKACYVTWDEYHKHPPRIRFFLKESG